MNTFEHLGDLSTYNLMNRRNYDMGRLGKPDLYGQAANAPRKSSPPISKRTP
ncbi:MAG: hypothetical protein ACLRWP_15470 [Bilophila wadsworthia]